ncbi:MAG: hypothetical protein OXE87_16740 [Chloroflexi bacterium]|nr:hypothetical protein [Chloroflexota bacterium]
MSTLNTAVEQLFARRRAVISALRRVKGHTARAKQKRADFHRTIARLDQRILGLRTAPHADPDPTPARTSVDEPDSPLDDYTELIEILEGGWFDEEFLETVLILMPELVGVPTVFLGRQMPTDSGVLDLIAVSELFHAGHATLTIFELKARRIQRRDIAQVLDYSLWCNETADDDLAFHIVRHSGKDDGLSRIMDANALSGVLRRTREWGRYVLPVVIGTKYDASVARLADRMEVRLLTVEELCQAWRGNGAITDWTDHLLGWDA